jgi:cytochrome b6-f complex iron-sulfur subunit
VSEHVERRRFLTRLWSAGGALVAAAGAWTTADLLKPLPAVGFGGKVRAVSADAVTAGTVVEVPAARAYLTTDAAGEVIALSEKCTHLGCRVPFCSSSGQFECPCHGSVFNRVGEYRAGPAPHGMDRYPVIIEEGMVVIDTSGTTKGPSPGSESIDEPPSGPTCASEGGE